MIWDILTLAHTAQRSRLLTLTDSLLRELDSVSSTTIASARQHVLHCLRDSISIGLELDISPITSGFLLIRAISTGSLSRLQKCWSMEDITPTYRASGTFLAGRTAKKSASPGREALSILSTLTTVVILTKATMFQPMLLNSKKKMQQRGNVLIIRMVSLWNLSLEAIIRQTS